jgi:hypothetical protein
MWGKSCHIPKDDPNANLGFPSSRRIVAGGLGSAKSHHILFVTCNKGKDGEAHAAASRALKIWWFIKSFGVEVISKLRIPLFFDYGDWSLTSKTLAFLL